MSCFFINPPERRIFANLTPPRKPPADTKAVLLCYPFGQEYMRAHRAFRQLANLLSRKGYTVMRFDYPGSGDSYGEADASSFLLYIEGAQRALNELKQKSNNDFVSIIGLRLGALVAAQLANCRNDVQQLILWDPFATGTGCLDDSKTEISNSHPPIDNTLWWLHGFPMSRQFRNELNDVDLTSMEFDHSMKIHQVISHENSETNTLLNKLGTQITQSLVPSLGDWNYVDMEGSILVPSKIIKKICSTLP